MLTPIRNLDLQTLLQIEKLQKLNRERLPPRILFDKGAGAFGYAASSSSSRRCARLFCSLFSSQNGEVTPRGPRADATQSLRFGNAKLSKRGAEASAFELGEKMKHDSGAH